MLHIDLHGTLMHFCCRELLFSHMNTVSLHTLALATKNTYTSSACKICMHSCTHTPSNGNI